ncbi:uncharacterized protein RCC_05945 [Ramularia collo-cygni]|uniref:Uncharacterized protein n=1 Tax=Ramularia collo-cygni TaxID=112498 RepID=A0A2D3UXE0_9PEZI|nr:uncharacterized protein RCC_05945 [Ramularia collo-cygni]CZT20088.1 uncharacterized protein RCC_05945 [Ramularia collo-cygni]
MSVQHPTELPSEVEAWLQEQTTYPREELLRGDGNHPDEIDAMRKFLVGTLTAHDAAAAIIHSITLEDDPPHEVYRLWGLLAATLVELGREVGRKSLDLLAAIQQLPDATTPTGTIKWSDLPGFGNMWYDSHSMHMDGSPPWESGREGILTRERETVLRDLYEDGGAAEASIWLRIPNVINPNLGYEVLNLSRSGRACLFINLHQVHGWLKIAGPQLRLDRPLDEVMRLERKAWGEYADATMEEHWHDWEKALAELSKDDSTLPQESRKVAGECLAMMQDARLQDPRNVSTDT